MAVGATWEPPTPLIGIGCTTKVNHVEGFQNGEWITLTLTRPDGNTLVSLEYASINDFRLPMRYESVP